MKDRFCYVAIMGNAPGDRIGIVRWCDRGYYTTTLDNSAMSDTDVKDLVMHLNQRLEVSPTVAQSAYEASMFGWHIPAAAEAMAWKAN